MSIEAMKLWLKALETSWYHVGTFCPTDAAIELYDKARDSLRQAIEQAQEPVAHWSDCAVHSEPAYPKGECDCGGFAASPQRQPLTDEIPKGVLLAISNAGLTLIKTQHGYELRKLGTIEATHGIKE